MLIGALAGAWLLPGPRSVGRVTLDVQTLLYAGMAVLIGFQAVLFAVFTKVFAVNSGLLPQDRKIESALRTVTLEAGLIAGALLFLFGIAGSLFAVGIWGEARFGALDPSQTLRAIIPAVICLTLGCEIILSSFFLSVLGMQRR